METDTNSPEVGIIMGSQSDWPTMREAAEILDALGISYDAQIVSAHRTPDRLWTYGKSAVDRGLAVIIAGAGGAAHLPGMMASKTRIPVIGVPVKSSNSIDGWDSILSILQMPGGVPVATVALDGAQNAGILAAQILGATHEEIRERITDYKENLKQKVIDGEVFMRLDKDNNMENKIIEIKLNIPRNQLFAKERAKSFEAASDLAIDALRKQIIKHKDKILSH